MGPPDSTVVWTRQVRVQLVRERRMAYDCKVQGPDRAAALARSALQDQDREAFLAIHLTNRLAVASFEVVSMGTINNILVHPREVFKGALLANAACIVVAHSHPSGEPEPSAEDLAITRRLVEAGELLGIPVHDHVIVAGERWLSLRESTSLWSGVGSAGD